MAATYDQDSYNLGAAFLGDDERLSKLPADTQAHLKEQLAIEIQVTIEDFLNYEAPRLADEFYCANHCAAEKPAGEDCALNGGCPLLRRP